MNCIAIANTFQIPFEENPSNVIAYCWNQAEHSKITQGESQIPTMQIYEDRFHCPVCGIKGGPLELVCSIKNCSRELGQAWLESHFRVSLKYQLV